MWVLWFAPKRLLGYPTALKHTLGATPTLAYPPPWRSHSQSCHSPSPWPPSAHPQPNTLESAQGSLALQKHRAVSTDSSSAATAEVSSALVLALCGQLHAALSVWRGLGVPACTLRRGERGRTLRDSASTSLPSGTPHLPVFCLRVSLCRFGGSKGRGGSVIMDNTPSGPPATELPTFL